MVNVHNNGVCKMSVIVFLILAKNNSKFLKLTHAFTQSRVLCIHACVRVLRFNCSDIVVRTDIKISAINLCVRNGCYKKSGEFMMMSQLKKTFRILYFLIEENDF